MSFDSNILGGARTAFIDCDFKSSSEFKPKLLANNAGEKVLNSIKEELHNCDEFFISVAFITMGGLTPLLEDFKELESRGVKGKILTTDYLNFTEPKSLKKLDSFSNIEIKLFSQENQGFHTKGYIFKKNNVYRGIIGSSNLTMNALTVNKEWNIGFSSLTDGEILNEVLKEFNELWSISDDLSDVISQYESIYDASHQFLDVKKNL